MRKKFILLNALFLSTFSSNLMIACNNKAEIKHEMTKKNLDTFFAKNNTFNYSGESFFKNDLTGHYDISGFLTNICKNIISDQFKVKFLKYFTINENYSLFLDTSRISDEKNFRKIKNFEIQKKYDFEFQIRIAKANENYISSFYITNQLTLQFKETNVFDHKKWLENYKNFLIDQCDSIFNQGLLQIRTSFSVMHHIYSGYEPDWIKEIIEKKNWNQIEKIYTLNFKDESEKKDYRDKIIKYMNSEFLDLWLQDSTVQPYRLDNKISLIVLDYKFLEIEKTTVTNYIADIKIAINYLNDNTIKKEFNLKIRSS